MRFTPSMGFSQRLIDLSNRLVRELVLLFQMKREAAVSRLARRFADQLGEEPDEIAKELNGELTLNERDVDGIIILSGRALREAGMAGAFDMERQQRAAVPDPFDDEPTHPIAITPEIPPPPLTDTDKTPVRRRPRRA